MPNKRGPNQKLLGVWLDQGFIQSLDFGRRKNHQSRSQFIREAILERLKSLGVATDESLVHPPDRSSPVTIHAARGAQVATHGGKIQNHHLNEKSATDMVVRKKRTAKI